MAAAAKDPRDAFQWAAEVDYAASADDLAEGGSMYKKKYASLESKLANGLLDILHGEFRRKIALRKQNYAVMEPPQMITGLKL